MPCYAIVQRPLSKFTKTRTVNMAVSRSSREYLQRHGIIPTLRQPMQRLNVSTLLVNSTPLNPPLPLAEEVIDAEGSPSPDRANTQLWPIELTIPENISA